MPETVVGVKVTVTVPQAVQVLMQHLEMLRFLVGHQQPVLVKLIRHAGEAPNGIESQIDGIEFDVTDGVKQCCQALRRERSTCRDLLSWNKAWQRRTARHRCISFWFN